MEASRNVPQTRTSSSSPDLLLPPPPPSSALLHNPTSPLGREWFSSPIFPSSNPLLPLRGGVYPSPYPLPWTWRGPVAGRWSAQDGPRWLQEGLRALKMASKIAQDLKIARHGSANSQHAPKRPQHRPTGIWGYGPTTRRQPRRRGAPGRPRGGWGEILSSDRVNVSRKLGGERELSSNLERFLRDALACIWLERGGRGIP